MTNPTSSAQKNPYQIVVGFDFSPLAERAFEQAMEIAEKHLPAELHVVTVAQPAGALVRLPGEADPVSEDLARETVRLRIGQLVEEYGTRQGAISLERVAIYVLSWLPVPAPGKVIADAARTVDANLIVVGTHGRTGISRLVLGSVANQVVREATCSVLVVRPEDFIHGEKVPEIQPPLAPGESPLRQFEHRRTYHYIDKVAQWTNRVMPVS